MPDEEVRPAQDEEKPLTVVVALAEDVKDARADVEEALREAARSAEASGRAAPYEVRVVEEGADFTFYPESPRVLLEDLQGRFDPDIIVAVFWKHFGTAPADPTLTAQGECEALAQALERPGHPPTLIFFLDDGYTPRTEEERARKDFVLYFRGLFKPGALWWFFKKRSTFRRSPHERELRVLAAKLLAPRVSRRPAEGETPRTDAYPVPALKLPEESWRLIKPKEISALRGELGPGGALDRVTAEKYFNGVVPSWREAVSQSIPRRVLVEELEKEMSAVAAAGRLRVTLLIGPGGEGKSTMLHQLAVDLTEKHPGLHLIWHESKYDPLGKDIIRQLLATQGSFVIASDDAEHIAVDVFDAVEFIHKQPRRNNIQFLLACRSTDWEWAGAPRDDRWFRILDRDFRKVPVNRLEEEDARRVVKAWKDAGALGHFASVREEDRARVLLAYAREEEDKYRHRPYSSGAEESSFLGAMLRARKSRTLEGYVGDILDRLKGRDAPGGKKNLRDVFAYVVAMHADNLPILYRPVLRHLLSCSWEELDNGVITPLADEAATDVSGRVILARHRRIAEVARDILCGEHRPAPERRALREAFERRYAELASAAVRKFRTEDGEIKGAEISPWNDLPDFYAERQQIDLALQIAEALADAEPEDPLPVTAWAHIYRRNRQGRQAVEIFRKRYLLLFNSKKLNKGFFTEWAAAEGREKNHCIDAWLAGIALSDRLGEKHEGDSASMILLSGLTSALSAVYRKTADEVEGSFYNESHAGTFLKAAVAASQLGLDTRAQEGLRLDYEKDTSIKYLNVGASLGRDKGVPAVEPGEAINRVIAGIRLAWELSGKDEQRWDEKDENWEKAREKLPAADKLTFGWVRRVFGARGGPGTPQAPVIKPLTRRPR